MDKPISTRSTMVVAAFATFGATAYALHESYDALSHIDAPNLKPNEAMVAAPPTSQGAVPVVERRLARDDRAAPSYEE